MCGMTQDKIMTTAENASTSRNKSVMFKMFLHYWVYMLSLEFITHLRFLERGKLNLCRKPLKKKKLPVHLVNYVNKKCHMKFFQLLKSMYVQYKVESVTATLMK